MPISPPAPSSCIEWEPVACDEEMPLPVVEEAASAPSSKSPSASAVLCFLRPLEGFVAELSPPPSPHLPMDSRKFCNFGRIAGLDFINLQT